MFGHALGVAAPPPAGLPVAEIERYVREEMALNRMPGLALAVVCGEQVWLGAWGVRSLTTGAPMTVDTPAELASVSKPLTAVAVAQLIRAGRLDPDGQASAWLPALRDGPLAHVRIRDLLRHRSGLRRAHDRLAAAGDSGSAWELGAAVARLGRARPRHPPGASFAYANSNYLLLAAVVEAASGIPFARYLRERVFVPLGMSRTTLEPEPARDWGRAELHELAWGRVRPRAGSETGWLGASRVKSTARDLAAFLGAVLRGEPDALADAKALIPPYDAGWFVSPRAPWAGGRLVLEHSGDIWGANAAVLVIPEARLGVAVLVNAGLNRAGDVARGVAVCALGQPAPRAARPHWARVADNWALIFAVGAGLTAVALAAYWVRLTREIRQRGRSLRAPESWWERGRLALLTAMAVYLLYLAAGRPGGAATHPPSSLRVALPALALAAAAALLTGACSALLGPRRQS